AGKGRRRTTRAASARCTSNTSGRRTTAATSIFSKAPRRFRIPRSTDVRTLPAASLVTFVTDVMREGGSATGEAATIARRLVDANLVGHDSHGVIRVGKYLEWVRAGWLQPNQPPTVAVDTDTLAIVDGNRGFGQVIGEFAAQLGIAKAAKRGIALVG